nr:amidohydrolase family protein [uncultured Bilophila sp.]
MHGHSGGRAHQRRRRLGSGHPRLREGRGPLPAHRSAPHARARAARVRRSAPAHEGLRGHPHLLLAPHRSLGRPSRRPLSRPGTHGPHGPRRVRGAARDALCPACGHPRPARNRARFHARGGQPRQRGRRALRRGSAHYARQALEAYTTNASLCCGGEADRGRIEPGRFADFVLLDKGIEAVEPDHIRDVKVRMTICGGRIVYQG